jgi:hypothetical protein
MNTTDIIKLQREIYRIAVSQHAINQLVVKDDTKTKQLLALKVNNSSKTAVPTILSTHDRDGISSNTSNDQNTLYEAVRNIIKNHNKPIDQQPLFITHERLYNAANHLAAKSALRQHPELKQYYKALPSIAKKADQIPGQHNKDKFSELTKSHIIAKIATTEKTKSNDKNHLPTKNTVER